MRLYENKKFVYSLNFFNIIWNFRKKSDQRSCRTWTQRIMNPNYDDSDGGDKSTLGKWTVKSFKCVMGKGLLFSAILTYPYYIVAYF